MADDLVTRMVPILGRSVEPGFNVFDVMHHGLHEKQISNVFRWLLDPEGTHRLGGRFVKVFVDQINEDRAVTDHLPSEGYAVAQEVNTSLPGEELDIADLVLESRDAVIVVENYFTSDGHGHSYGRYERYSERNERQGAVVLLCREADPSVQVDGWQAAHVLTYKQLIGTLFANLAADKDYQERNAPAFAFIEQIHQKFVRGRGPMEDRDVLDFVVAMCASGEALRYQLQHQEAAAQQFANDLADQAKERFGEGRGLLQEAKGRLRRFSAEVLAKQLNETFDSAFVQGVDANLQSLYQWTINFTLAEQEVVTGRPNLQIKFGPSAWFTNERDSSWERTVAAGVADYSRLFLTRAPLGEVRQSAVSLQEVLDGLDPTDRRLHDEIVKLVEQG